MIKPSLNRSLWSLILGVILFAIFLVIGLCCHAQIVYSIPSQDGVKINYIIYDRTPSFVFSNKTYDDIYFSLEEGKYMVYVPDIKVIFTGSHKDKEILGNNLIWIINHIRENRKYYTTTNPVVHIKI